MGFVREPIGEADRPRVDAILERVGCTHPLINWTVDREKNAFLLNLENLTREPGPTIYASVLVLNEGLIRMRVAFISTGNNSSGINLQANAHITWVSPNLVDIADEVIALVRAALSADLFGLPPQRILTLEIGVTTGEK